MELWRDVVGYEGLYQVSDRGNIRRITGIDFRYLSFWMDKQGFWTFRPCKEGKSRIKMVHRVQYEAFVGPIPEDHVVIHLNDDKTDNRPTNLGLKLALEVVRTGAKKSGWKKRARKGRSNG